MAESTHKVESVGLIYGIIHKVSGKLYIGKTSKTIRKRWRIHVAAAKYGRSSYLYSAIRKDGECAFDIYEIDRTPLEKLSEMEVAYIAVFGTTDRNRGYNMTIGGDGAGAGPNHPSYGTVGANRGRAFSEAFKQKARSRQLGKRRTMEQRAAVSSKLTGIVRSEETKERMRTCKLGANNPMFGKQFSEQHREHLKQSAKVRWEREANKSSGN